MQELQEFKILVQGEEIRVCTGESYSTQRNMTGKILAAGVNQY